MSDDIRAYALRLLGQRSYTTRNLRQKLLRKEFPAEETESLIERLAENGLLDDRKFALSFARSRLTTSSASPRRVRQLLMQKGINSAIADEAVAEVLVEEEIDTAAALKRVASKKFATMAGLERDVIRRRLSGFLARRGYDLDEIRSVVADLLR
jgi:regulatory protein